MCYGIAASLALLTRPEFHIPLHPALQEGRGLVGQDQITSPELPVMRVVRRSDTLIVMDGHRQQILVLVIELEIGQGVAFAWQSQLSELEPLLEFSNGGAVRDFCIAVLNAVRLGDRSMKCSCLD